MATVSPVTSGHRNGAGRSAERLKSWKEIAAYFGTDERTVRRWEVQRGLPVHRLPGTGRGTVYAETAELEGWLHSPPGPQAGAGEPRPGLERRTLLIGAGVGALTLGAAGWNLWRARPTPAAESLVARGIAASRLGTADSTAEAVGLLQDAVEATPRDPDAWGALALASFDSQFFLDDRAAAAAVKASDDAARRALQLDPHNAAAAAALALAVPTYGNWAQSESRLRAVLQRDAGQFEARLALSRLLANVGRGRDALVIARPLRDSQPTRPNIDFWIGYLLWLAGEPQASDRLLGEAMHRWPRNYMVWFARYWQLLYSGQAGAALALSRDTGLRPIGIPEWNFALLQQTASAAISRSEGAAKGAVAAHLAAARRGAGLAENAIEVAAWLAAPDAAFAAAEAYFFGRGFAVASTRYSDQQGSFTRPLRRETKMLFSPASAPMRADARFAELVRKIGLDRYWQASGTRPPS